MQLVGEVMGQVSDALDRNKTPGFDETNVTNDWGRIILEAAGSAAVAGTTGGNVGSAAASSAVSTATIAATGQYIADNALSLAGGDKEVATILTNIGMNIAASGAGAAAGAATGGAIGGGAGALNGADISSTFQQYNMAIFLQQAAVAAGGGAIAAGNNPNTLTDADIQQIQNAFSNSVNSTANLVEWGPLYAYAYLYNLIYGDTQSSGSASNEMTALPDANKGTTLTTPIVENNGTTVSTPIQAGDKKCLGFMLVKVA